MSQTLTEEVETEKTFRDFTNTAHNAYKSYAFAAGVFNTVLLDAMHHLPRRRREEIRSRIEAITANIKNQKS